MCDTPDEKDRKEPLERPQPTPNRNPSDTMPLTWECTSTIAEMDPDEFYASHGNGD